MRMRNSYCADGLRSRAHEEPMGKGGTADGSTYWRKERHFSTSSAGASHNQTAERVAREAERTARETKSTPFESGKQATER